MLVDFFQDGRRFPDRKRSAATPLILVTKLQLPARIALNTGLQRVKSVAVAESGASFRWLRQGSHFSESGWKRSERPEPETWAGLKARGNPDV